MGVGKAVGGAVLLGAGVYYGQVAYDVYKAEKEQRQFLDQHHEQVRERVDLASTLTDVSQRAVKLESQRQLFENEEKNIGQELQAALAKVEDLRKKQTAAKLNLKETQLELQESGKYLQRLKDQLETSNHHLQLIEQSLGTAQRSVNQAKLLLNPLNHPTVKQYLKEF